MSKETKENRIYIEIKIEDNKNLKGAKIVKNKKNTIIKLEFKNPVKFFGA